MSAIDDHHNNQAKIPNHGKSKFTPRMDSHLSWVSGVLLWGHPSRSSCLLCKIFQHKIMILLTPTEVSTEYKSLLSSLSDNDKLLRFGYMTTEANLQKHVDNITNSSTPVYGVFDPIHGLVAAIEVWKSDGIAELGLVVSDKTRGQGIGSTLFRNACVWLHATGITEIIIYVKAHNTWMRRIASEIGMKIIHAGCGEVEYHLLYDGLPDYTSVVSLSRASTTSAVNRQVNFLWNILKYISKPFNK